MNTVPEFTSEAQKFDYPLTRNSVVIDCGAYEGNWSREIARRYGCRIVAFEPCKRFYRVAALALAAFPSVTIFNFGVAAISGKQEIGVSNDSTGLFSLAQEREIAEFIRIDRFMPEGEISLLKLNVEGAEFEVLEMITADPYLAKRFKNILVQFHTCVPDLEPRLAKIQAALALTHDLAWGSNPFLWQSFKLRAS